MTPLQISTKSSWDTTAWFCLPKTFRWYLRCQQFFLIYLLLKRATKQTSWLFVEFVCKRLPQSTNKLTTTLLQDRILATHTATEFTRLLIIQDEVWSSHHLLWTYPEKTWCQRSLPFGGERMPFLPWSQSSAPQSYLKQKKQAKE